MSLPISVLQSLQQAGQGIHNSSLTLTQAVSTSATRMMSSIARDPFSPDGEAVFVRVRAMARLSYELTAMESRLRELYEQAQKLSDSEPIVEVTALPSPNQVSSVSGQSHEHADDVDNKREKPAKFAGVKKTDKLTSNDLKLLNGLKASLTGKSWIRMTHSAMASASGLPSGSVGISLRKLIEAGIVMVNKEGCYRIG